MDLPELLEFANDAVIVTDSDGTILYWNHGARSTYGWEKTEAVGQNVHALLRTELSGDAQNLEQALTKQIHWGGTLNQIRRNGEQITVASRWTRNEDPASPRLQINRDITADTGDAAALRESEARYRRFITEDLTGILDIQPDGRITMCNPDFVNTFGFASIEEASSENFFKLLRNRKEGAELLKLVQEEGVVERHELEMNRRAGDRVHVIARLVGSFTDGNLTSIHVYLFNDTKRKRLEQQIIDAQKMEGLGTLAGGIAHDFNNILAIILGYTNRLQGLQPTPDGMTASIKIIKEAVDRGATLVQQLLTTARQTEARLSTFDLNALVRELVNMLQATFPKIINFELGLRPDVPLIKADRSQMHQVLLNLCVNARDAMQKGGTLTLETNLMPGAELIESFTGASAQNYVCIHVSDTGSGMSKEIKSHIFEPFFTTKERGQGTGLGLSVVYGVVNNHRGFVQVESRPGSGTGFTIYLPVEHSTDEKDGGTMEPAMHKKNLPQTILLVEDEEMLRDLGIMNLESEGYRVLAAKDGVEAVAMFEANREDIGLVVCDLGLPRLGGREAFLKMKETRPSVRAIVASGYLEPAMRSEMLKAGVLDTIQKPYDFNELLLKIRSVIGTAVSRA